MNKSANSKLGKGNWVAIVLLAFSGQIAWAVENTWFNTFIDDTISKDPAVISAMVAASAITATVATFVMGTFSDRIGKRKTIILVGYILWGFSTAIFPLSSLAQSTALAVVLLIVLDCVMTFFGSTANDACFNAWVTDITDSTNRGKVSGVLEVFPLIALVVTTVVSGVVIENFGYTVFFAFLGIIVGASGLVGAIFMQDKVQKTAVPKVSFTAQLKESFSFGILKGDKKLTFLLISILVFTAAEQISTPYQIIYFTDTLGFDYGEVGIYLGAMTLLAGICGVVFGFFVDKIGKQKTMVFSLIVSAIGFFVVAFATEMLLLCVGIFIMAFGIVAKIIVSGAWLRDMTPQGKVGGFQGVRMVFRVLLPMVIGPFIGQFIISSFGQPVQGGFLPTNLIFIAAGICTLLTFIPLYFIIKAD